MPAYSFLIITPAKYRPVTEEGRAFATGTQCVSGTGLEEPKSPSLQTSSGQGHCHVLQLHLLGEREEVGGAPYSSGWISERQYFRASDVRGRICCCSLTFFCGWVLGNIRRWLEKTNAMGIIWLFSYPSCAHLHPGHCIPQKSPSQMVLPFSLYVMWGQLLTTTRCYSISSILILLLGEPVEVCLITFFFYHCIRWNHSSAYCTSIIKYLSRMSQVLWTITLVYGYLKFLLRLLTNFKKWFDISILKEATEPKELVDVFFEMEYISSHLWSILTTIIPTQLMWSKCLTLNWNPTFPNKNIISWGSSYVTVLN